MAQFNGIAIADPSKKGLNFVTEEGFRSSVVSYRPDDDTRKTTVIEGVSSSIDIAAHYTNILKDPFLPHTTLGDQEVFNNFSQDYETVKGFRVDETVTIPITNGIDRALDDQAYEDEIDNQADVEEAILETGKKITNLNGNGYYDPGIKELKTSEIESTKVFVPVQKFGRPQPDNPTFLTNPQEFADEKNYIYVNGDRSYQSRYYSNNSWLDSDTGRIHLFEKPREATRIA